MKVLVTGSAGFIGSSVAMYLLGRGDQVVGVDIHNDYYDPSLKEARVDRLTKFANYRHARLDITDRASVEGVFSECKPDAVINLAAQAGVRYSIENPSAYIQSNVVGFLNILEGCRQHHVGHLVYASSSSVYGANVAASFSESQSVNHPLSLYAATKKSNELMAHTYSHLYEVPTTGLRFFTVYGPWGRPDMALFKFTRAMLAGDRISVFNGGHHRRDFTYVDDVVDGVVRVLDRPASGNSKWRGEEPDPATSSAPWRVYNIGNNRPVELMGYIKILEEVLGKPALIDYLPLQQGDVPNTCADIENVVDQFGYQPKTTVRQGVEKFVAWYREYYKV